MSQTSKTKRTTRSLLAAATLSAAVLGAGCELLGLDGGETVTPPTEQAAAPTADAAPKQTPPPTPVVAAAPAEDYQRPDYPNMARRNPFQPDLEVVQPANLPAQGDERTLEPLEKYAIGELELVAIISEVAVPKAMFIDPEGFGHVLKEGDRVGRNSGVVSDIRDNEVEITETTGEEGGGQTRLRNVRLRDAELAVGDDSGLSEEERAALEKLLQTEEGRKAVERQYRDMALGASASEQQSRGTSPQGQAPPSRFPGVRPPSQEDN